MTDVKTRIAQFVKLRDLIDELDEAHKVKMKPYNDLKEQLEGVLLAQLNAVGGNNIATDAGTAFRKEKKSATIADGAAFRRHVIGSEAWDLVDWKANVTAVEAFITEQETAAKADPTVVVQAPPGINWSTRYVAQVRRPGKTKA